MIVDKKIFDVCISRVEFDLIYLYFDKSERIFEFGFGCKNILH